MKGRVPSLVTSEGRLTETPGVLAFIAQTYPKARLAPVDQPFAFGSVQAFNSYLCSTVHVAHAHRMRGYPSIDITRSQDGPGLRSTAARKLPSM